MIINHPLTLKKIFFKKKCLPIINIRLKFLFRNKRLLDNLLIKVKKDKFKFILPKCFLKQKTNHLNLSVGIKKLSYNLILDRKFSHFDINSPLNNINLFSKQIISPLLKNTENNTKENLFNNNYKFVSIKNFSTIIKNIALINFKKVFSTSLISQFALYLKYIYSHSTLLQQKNKLNHHAMAYFIKKKTPIIKLTQKLVKDKINIKIVPYEYTILKKNKRNTKLSKEFLTQVYTTTLIKNILFLNKNSHEVIVSPLASKINLAQREEITKIDKKLSLVKEAVETLLTINKQNESDKSRFTAFEKRKTYSDFL